MNCESSGLRTKLLPHNKIAYQKICKAFETSDRTCVVHPTGTGKSYLIAAVSENYKNVLILGPNNFVLNQVHDVLAWRKNGIEYMTYSMLSTIDVKPKDYSLICLDEFHRVGAATWQTHVKELLDANPQAKVFGTTATPIRFLDNERDMSEEIFGHNVASYIPIGEAWSRGILPIPAFVVGLFDFHKTLEDAERYIRDTKKLSDDEKRKRLFKLSNARLEWENSLGMPSILQRHLDKDIRRVIIFCADIARLESMRDTVIGWFRVAGFTVASACTVHAGLPTGQIRKSMDEFESDDSDGVRLMFSVNMLNEGIHVPRVGAVLMLRTTESRIIYLQQMGRCLTAANTNKPVILDMVDNITTTSVAHFLEEDFAGWQDYMKEEDIDYAMRRFHVTDYRKSVRDVLELLSPAEVCLESWQEKYEQVMSFVDEKNRLPVETDGAIYRKFRMLLRNKDYEKEMNELFKRFGRLRWTKEYKEYMLSELHHFWDMMHRPPRYNIPEERVLYRMLGVIWNHEPDNSIFTVMNIQMDHPKMLRGEAWFKNTVTEITDFGEEHGRLPGQKEMVLRQKWYRLVSNYGDRPEVVALKEKYSKNRQVKKRNFPELLKKFEDHAIRTGFLPNDSRQSDKELVKDFWWACQVKKNDPKFKELLDRFPKYDMIEASITRIENFYGKNGRLPKSNSEDKEECHLYTSMIYLFSEHAGNERVKSLRNLEPDRQFGTKKGLAKVNYDDLFAKIEDHAARTGFLPNDSIQAGNELAQIFHTVSKRKKNDPRFKKLLEEYPKYDKITATICRINGFYKKNGRYPHYNKKDKEELNIYCAMKRLFEVQANHEDVKALKKEYEASVR